MAASDETSVALTRGLPPALHYELEQVSKMEILRKLKNASVRKPSATFISELARGSNSPGGDLRITSEHPSSSVGFECLRLPDGPRNYNNMCDEKTHR